MSSPPVYDVVVVGAGHAGIEAALTAARLGATTLLLTLNLDSVGQMSCNPAIGGIGKGHLVREIDALGGEMAHCIDATGIQFRRLNTRKGPAVQATRAQADRSRYSRRMKQRLENHPHLTLRQEEAVGLQTREGRVTGILTRCGSDYPCRAVVLCPGTFLNGLAYIGLQSFPAGRAGDPPSELLAHDLARLGLPLGRLKTGTPPRLNGNTIDWERLEPQHGDHPPPLFSSASEPGERRQVACHITYTGPDTHDIIRAGLDRSPLYTGVIEGIGPRYCPSIEDKITRFPDRERHHVFLEPEGLDTREVYPNGISTSLPLDVQMQLVRSITGLERAEILRPGYAIEYDFVNPTALYPTLEAKTLEGLFLAGQINGTSGYEEAGAQGLLAGINAAHRAQNRDGITIPRHQGYLGVMVDDLVTQGVREPYRMFTSRAEYRLLLREDNADLRLSPLAEELGCLAPEDSARFRKRRLDLAVLREFLEHTRLAPSPVTDRWFQTRGAAPLQQVHTLTHLLKRPEVTIAGLKDLVEGWPDATLRDEETLEVEIKYAGYVVRDQETLARTRRVEETPLPPDLDYTTIPGLPVELQQLLATARPLSLGQALRLPGMRPSAAPVLQVHLKKLGQNP